MSPPVRVHHGGARVLALAMLLGTAIAVCPAAEPPAEGSPATEQSFAIHGQSLASALNAFALQTHQQILFTPEATDGKTTLGVRGTLTPDAALQKLLARTGLVAARSPNGMILVTPADAKEASARSDPHLAPKGASRSPGTQAPPARRNSPDTDGRLEEIVVTARKAAEPMQSVPLSIQVFDPTQLARAGQGGLLEIAQLTPGFVFQTYNGSFEASPTIRGLSQFDITSSVANVSTVVDGVYVPRNYAVDLGIADVSRVEIVKGPQSALYGSNAFAGVIAYTLAPPPARPEAQLSAIGGNGGRFDYRLAAGDALYDGRLAVRVNYARSKYEGTWTNLWPADSRGRVPTLGGHDSEVYGATLRLFPAAAVELDLDYFHLDRHEDLKPAFNVTSIDATNQFNCNPFICGPLSWNVADYQSASSKHRPGLEEPYQPGFTSRTRFFSARINVHVTDELQLHYIYGWVDSMATEITTSSDDPLNPGLGFNFNTYVSSGCLAGAPTCSLGIGNWDTSSKQSGTNRIGSHELRVEWNHGPWKALLGAYHSVDTDFYQFADGSFQAGTALVDAPYDPHDFSQFLFPLLGQIRTTRATAQFARLSYDFADARANLAAEIRHEQDDLASLASTTGSLQGAAAGDIVYRRSGFSDSTPRITASYKLTPGNLLYASAAQGVKQGGFNSPTDGGKAVPDAEQTFAPEKNWTYELGSKNAFLDGRAILNADVFLVRWTNLQIQEEPSNAGSTIMANITVNQGGATSRGFESEGRFAATRNLQLMYAFAFIDSSFDAGAISGQVIGLCNDLICPKNGAIGGLDLPRYSKVQGTLGATWKHALARGCALSLHGEATYQSPQQADASNITRIPARTLVNLSAGLGGERWDATLWGRNVLDRKYVADSYFIPAPSLHAVAYSPSLGELATYGLTLNLRLF